jgi:hypothetical protein
MYVYSRNVTITIPNNISINLASTPTSANCSNDIGAGYYPSLSQCIYICPCNTKGLFCNFTDASVTSTALPTTTNQFCGSYSFESTPKTTTLNPTYQLSSTTDVPHYKVTVVLQLFVTGYSGSDVLTIWADLTVVQYTVLLLSRLNKICSPNITGEGMYVNQTIQHYAPTIQLQIVLQSIGSGYIYLNKAKFVLSTCYTGCQYCSGPLQSDCINCSPPFVFSSAGMCYCPATAVLVNPSVCISCDTLFTNCSTCNTSSCLSCENNVIINSDMTCIDATSCVRDCLICDMTNIGVCLVCQTNFFLLNSSYCQMC